LCRMLKGRSDCYLVNKLYIARLLSFYIQQLRSTLGKTADVDFAVVQQGLQAKDMWICFHVSIGFVGLDHKHLYLSDLASVVDRSQNVSKIELVPSIPIQKIGIVNVAFGKASNDLCKEIQRDSYLKLLKSHKLVFFLISDIEHGNQTEQG